MRNELYSDGVLIEYEEIEDNGDGTGKRFVYDGLGNLLSQENLTDLPAPDPASFDSEMQAKLATLGAALLSDPDVFNSLVSRMSDLNPAKGPLSYVSEAIQTAASVTEPTE